MTPRLAWACMATLSLAACSEINPIGTYQTTPESLVRSIESNLPSKESPLGRMMRERLESMSQGASKWRVTLELKPDKSFALEMVLPLVPGPTRSSGTWRQSGTALQLDVTHFNGEKLEEPYPATGTIAADAITLQPEPSAPSFTLEKQPT